MGRACAKKTALLTFHLLDLLCAPSMRLAPQKRRRQRRKSATLQRVFSRFTSTGRSSKSMETQTGRAPLTPGKPFGRKRHLKLLAGANGAAAAAPSVGPRSLERQRAGRRARLLAVTLTIRRSHVGLRGRSENRII